ncbi:MAG: respiratory nitrate reductase subunit gamma [Planctomycetes bacterium RBG_16_64_10]|nr:MAG: respiratory nitrate reductase subunit gamma [Planctomycetes bacterium RBG_16_64_10]
MTGIEPGVATLLLGVLPYVALFTFLLVTIQRYRARAFTYSSLSSQFLENRQHFWALVPFHYGIIILVFGHLVGLLIPRAVLLWNSHPLRLYVLEVIALAFGVLTLVGLLSLVVRRARAGKVRVTTSVADWIVYALLLVQVATGIAVAVLYPWGTSWYAAAAAPYLQSILLLRPDFSYVAAMPLLVQLHIVNAFVIIALFPFTRLVHILVIPNPYLWRKPQVVRWYGQGSAETGR